MTGMGKSGHIANKIAATLASTGTPAFFVHPAEAQHGDMGMITRDDVVIALSNSGGTSEVIALLPLFKRLGVSHNRHDRQPEFAAGYGLGRPSQHRCRARGVPSQSGTNIQHHRLTGYG